MTAAVSCGSGCGGQLWAAASAGASAVVACCVGCGGVEKLRWARCGVGCIVDAIWKLEYQVDLLKDKIKLLVSRAKAGQNVRTHKQK